MKEECLFCTAIDCEFCGLEYQEYSNQFKGEQETGDLDSGDLDSGDLEAGDLEAGDLEAGDLEPNFITYGVKEHLSKEELSHVIEYLGNISSGSYIDVLEKDMF